MITPPLETNCPETDTLTALIYMLHTPAPIGVMNLTASQLARVADLAICPDAEETHPKISAAILAARMRARELAALTAMIDTTIHGTAQRNTPSLREIGTFTDAPRSRAAEVEHTIAF